MRIIRKELRPSELLPAGTRYDPENDVVQQLIDDTWVDNPDADPRNIDAFPPPDSRCAGADRMRAFLQALEASIENTLNVGATVAEGATALLLIMAFIPVVNILFALVASIYLQTVALGYAAVHTAFDGFAWDELMCLIYARLNINGFITDSQLEALKADIDDAFPGNAATVLNALLTVAGRGGLNDASALRTETGDCASCSPAWGMEWNFAESYGGWTLTDDTVNNPRGTFVGGIGLVAHYFPAAGKQYTIGDAYTQSQPMTTFTQLEIEYTADIECLWDTYQRCPANVKVGDMTVPAGDHLVATFPNWNVTTCGLRMYLYAAGSHSLIIHRARAFGDGSPPTLWAGAAWF